MIDLSGLSPGIAYVMGALPPGFAWLPAGYPFSDDFCELRAWFIAARPYRPLLARHSRRSTGISKDGGSPSDLTNRETAIARWARP